jgi:hypothetical protein
MFTAMGVEKIGRQIANDPDVMAAEGLKVLNEADNQIGPVNKTQGMYNTTEGVLYRTGTKVEVSAIYGTQITTHPRTAEISFN